MKLFVYFFSLYFILLCFYMLKYLRNMVPINIVKGMHKMNTVCNCYGFEFVFFLLFELYLDYC